MKKRIKYAYGVGHPSPPTRLNVQGFPGGVGLGGGKAAGHFSAEFNTALSDGTSSPAAQLVLPFPAGTHTVHWGDGIVNTANSHTYLGGPLTYTVDIFEPVTNWRFANVGDKYKLTKVVSLGEGFELNQGAFQGCFNMVWETTDTPIIQAGSQANTFSQCEQFNPSDTSTWNMSAVTNMSNMFFGAFNFQGNGAEDWDVGLVQSFSQTFFATHSFNAPIGVWNIISATNIGGMFRSNNGFNQPLNGWGSKTQNIQQMNHVFSSCPYTHDLDQWDVGSVTTTHAMFSSNNYNGNITTWAFGASYSDASWTFAGNNSFNRDIGGWNVANVTNMSNMFGGASSFNQELTWSVPLVTNMTTMLDNCGMSQANYDAWLINLDAQTIQQNITMGVQGLVYTFAVASNARSSLIITDLMTILGDSGV